MNVIWVAGLALAVAGASADKDPASVQRTEVEGAPSVSALPEGASTEFWEEPKGAPADVALWREAIGVGKQVTVSRLRANKMQWNAKQRNYDERLAKLAAGEPGEKAREAAALRPTLSATLLENNALLTGRWPVDPTRGCQYPAQNLAGVMGEQESPKKPTRILIVREDAEDCVAKAKPAIAQMERSSDALEKLIARAEALLPPLAPGFAPGMKVPPALPFIPPATALPAGAPPAGVVNPPSTEATRSP